MKRSKALKLLKHWAEDELAYRDRTGPLCIILPSCVRAKWCDYWDSINDEGLSGISVYYRKYSSSDRYQDITDEVSLLRLLMIHDFINETYRD